MLVCIFPMNISSYFVLAKLRPEHYIYLGPQAGPAELITHYQPFCGGIVNSGRLRISSTPGLGEGATGGLGSNPSFDQFSLKTTWKCIGSRNRGVPVAPHKPTTGTKKMHASHEVHLQGCFIKF